jgi:hypothetical protein
MSNKKQNGQHLLISAQKVEQSQSYLRIPILGYFLCQSFHQFIHHQHHQHHHPGLAQ